MNPVEEQTLALASMLQCAELIQQIAQTGQVNQPAFEASMDTLFQFDAPNTLAIFGDLSALITGIKSIMIFDKQSDKTPDQRVVYYVISMMKLATRLNKDAQNMKQIQTGLEKIKTQSQQFDLSINATSHKIDLLYQDTISKVKPRIMVQGNQQHLSAADNTSKVRTLLFCGIRAAFLWNQLGGSKWKLLFSKKRYVDQAQTFLKDLQI